MGPLPRARLPAAVPGQVCTTLAQAQNLMAAFQLLAAGSDLNSWLPLTTPPAIISIFASDNSFLALGEQTTRY